MKSVACKRERRVDILKSGAGLVSDFVLENSALSFSLRTMLACALALLAAFEMQLEAPYWAALTVWIIAHPHPTQVWGKGLFRIIGTLIGAAVAVVFTALFAQTPEIFILALALWSGLCTGMANLLKHFHSYAAMLAGYTAVIVAVAVVDRPLHVWETALARASCVMLGVAAVSIVSAVFHRDTTSEEAAPVAKSPLISLNFREALIAGFRALMVIGLAGAFWIATASATAASMLLIVAIMCGLFATHPAPHHASVHFGLVILWSGVAAFLCLYGMIQQVESFPLLILSLAVFLIPGGLAMANPKTAFFGLGFTVNFMNQIQPANPMHYDIAVFLNNLTASLVGSGLVALAFLLIFPRDSHD